MINRRNFMQYLIALYIQNPRIQSKEFTTSLKNFKFLSKSIWVWSSEKIDLTEVSSFSLHYGFNPIFLALPTILKHTTYHKLRSKINKMQAQGLTIYLTGGDPKWINMPLDDKQFNFLLENALALKANGIALDIEPQSLPGWESPEKRSILSENYYTLVRAIKAKSSLHNLPIITTIIPEYDSLHTENNNNLITSLGGIVQQVVLMSYCKQIKTGIINAENAIENLELSQTPYWYGINIPRTPSAESTPLIELNKMISSSIFINRKLQQRKMFIGVAYNDYKKVKELFESAYKINYQKDHS